MSNLSDKDIDRISREAAEFYEPDSSSMSWSRLEQKLTEHLPERPPDRFRFGRINPFIWGTAVIFLTGIAYFSLKRTIYSEHSTRNFPTLNKPASPVSTDLHPPGRISVYKDSISDAVSATSPKPDAASTSVFTSPSIRNNSNESALNNHKTEILFSGKPGSEKQFSRSKRNAKSSGQYLLNASSNSNGTAAAGISNRGNAGQNPTIFQSSSGMANPASVSGLKANTGDNVPSKEAAKLPALVIPGFDLPVVNGNDSLLNRFNQPPNSAVPQRSMRINRSLNIGISFGPDYTDGGGITNNQLSNNIGITIGYYLTRKISINSGFFYSNKFYWSPGDHESPQPAAGQSANTYAAFPHVEFINGACNMFEIPLGIRFDFAKNQKTKFFVNTGLSSYLFRKQTYIFYFHNAGRGMAWKKDDYTHMNYWFGVADISAGMETDMGKGFSFQAEPFIRLPLHDMGTLNTKMNSFGLLFSFRYSPVLSRSKK